MPLTYTPASIHAKVDAVDEGHGPDGHDSGYGASIAGPSNPQPESSRAQPELSHTQSDEDTAVIPNQLLDVADISSQASMTDGEAQAGESSKNTGKRKRPVDDGDEVPEPREHLANRPATTDAERRAEIRRLLTRTREMTARFNQEIYGPGDSGILSSHAAEPVGPVQSVSPDPDSIQVMMDRDEECIGKNFYPELGGWY